MTAYIQINMHNTHLTIAVHVLMHLCCVCKFQVANMLCGKAQRWLRCTVDVHRSHLLSTGARRILVRKTVILVKWAKMTGPTIDLPKEVCMFAHRLVDLLCFTWRLINMAKVSKNQGDASTNNPKAPAPDVYKSAVWTVFFNSWIWCQCQWERMCSVRPSQSRIILACGDAHGQLWTPWMSSPSCSIFSPKSSWNPSEAFMRILAHWLQKTAGHMDTSLQSISWNVTLYKLADAATIPPASDTAQRSLTHLHSNLLCVGDSQSEEGCAAEDK